MLYYDFIDFLFLLYFFGVQKINQKNTWELNLIDHLTEVIKVEEEDDAETNFQKVLCCDFCGLCGKQCRSLSS